MCVDLFHGELDIKRILDHGITNMLRVLEKTTLVFLRGICQGTKSQKKIDKYPRSLRGSLGITNQAHNEHDRAIFSRRTSRLHLTNLSKQILLTPNLHPSKTVPSCLPTKWTWQLFRITSHNNLSH